VADFIQNYIMTAGLMSNFTSSGGEELKGVC